ncbi:MAG: HTTM domain-containing protein [Polyangiaceae bacterium]
MTYSKLYGDIEDFFDQPSVGVAANWIIGVSASLIALGILLAHFRVWDPFPRLRKFIRERYMVVDLRAAGIFRLVLGTLLTLDTIRHANEARLLYSNSGVLANDYHQWQPTSRFQFSIFETFSTLNEVRVLFALGVVSHLFLLFGYRARLFAFLSFVFMTSMDVRIPFVENGGYIVVNLACLWAVFLPIGERFSVDAWIRSWRRRRERTIEDLNDRSADREVPSAQRGGPYREAPGGPGAPPSNTSDQQYVSWIGLMIVVNLGIIYFWNVVNKAGQTWRAGHTVHYVLYLSRMITGLSVFVRNLVPEPLMRVTDWVVLAVEASICVFIMSPRSKRYTRPLAMLLMIGLHSTFGFMMRLGPFSWFLCGSSTLLLSREQFEDVRAWYERRAPRWEVGVSVASPLGMTLARVLRRLDHWERLTFVPREEGDGALLTIRASAEAPFESDPRAVAKGIARALPLGKWLYPIVNVVTLGAFPRLLGGGERPRLVRFFALDRDRAETPARSAIGNLVATNVFRLRESFLAYLALMSLGQTLWEQKSIPTQIKPEDRPDFMAMTIDYPRLFQGWGMFAPNPIIEDGILVIDAYTIDGRRIDPYNGGGPVDLDITDDTSRGLSQLRQDYGNRIRLDHNKHYRDGIRNWLSEYPQITGNPADEIVAFDVYWVRDKCPAVGSKHSTNNDAVPLYSWRKPNYKRPPNMIPIPPPPKVRSAEKWDEGTP